MMGFETNKTQKNTAKSLASRKLMITSMNWGAGLKSARSGIGSHLTESRSRALHARNVFSCHSCPCDDAWGHRLICALLTLFPIISAFLVCFMLACVVMDNETYTTSHVDDYILSFANIRRCLKVVLLALFHRLLPNCSARILASLVLAYMSLEILFETCSLIGIWLLYTKLNSDISNSLQPDFRIQLTSIFSIEDSKMKMIMSNIQEDNKAACQVNVKAHPKEALETQEGFWPKSERPA
jgi:hypothetical protein